MAGKWPQEISNVSGIIAKSLYFIVFSRHQSTRGVFWKVREFPQKLQGCKKHCFSCGLGDRIGQPEQPAADGLAGPLGFVGLVGYTAWKNSGFA